MLCVIIIVVSLFLVMMCVVSFSMNVVVFGLSVVVCLLSSRICDGCSDVISRFMVCCWLFDSSLIWLVSWFFSLRFSSCSLLWNSLCDGWLSVVWKLCCVLCVIVSVMFFLIVNVL